jgi:hypothetical protein
VVAETVERQLDLCGHKKDQQFFIEAGLDRQATHRHEPRSYKGDSAGKGTLRYQTD